MAGFFRHVVQEKKENLKNRFGSRSDLTYHREKYYR
jgi:hypothetical protein